MKQTPHAWYQRFAAYIGHLGFRASTSDTSLFVFKDHDSVAYLLLYVDDIILTASSQQFLQIVTDRLRSEFAMTDLVDLHHFLGISVCRGSSSVS